MSDSKWKIRNKTHCKYLSISLASFFRLGEVVGKIGYDEFVPGYAGRPYRCFIDVCDFPIWVDRNERVKRGLNEASCILRRAFNLCNITGCREDTKYISQIILVNGRIV